MSQTGSLPNIEKGRYRHNKSGKLYRVIGMALHTESEEPLVIYQPLYNSEFQFFARPYKMFDGEVEVDGVTVRRFERIGD
jgi:hypothetical protein